MQVFRMDARDRSREFDAQERARAEQENRELRERSKSANEKKAEALIREGLPTSIIRQRTGLSVRIIRRLAKQLGAKLPGKDWDA